MEEKQAVKRVGGEVSPGVIAFVALEFYPATAGGTGILLHHTVRSLLRRGHEVVLLVDMQRHEYERIRGEIRLGFENGGQLDVHLADDLLAGTGVETVRFVDPEQQRSARLCLALEALIARRRIDLVEFYDYCGPAYYALGGLRGSGAGIAVRLHNTVELIQRRIRGPVEPSRLVQFAMERTSIAGADLLLAPGAHYFDEEILSLYPEAAQRPMQLSPPIHAAVGSVHYDVFARDVVFYGRLSTFKGLDTFLRAALIALQDERFSAWLGRFLIIGPEETVATAIPADEMRAMIPAGLLDRFEFTGRMSHEALFPRLGSAAFACFANRIESFCYAAHELATAGMPLILNDTPAFRDHFRKGSEALFCDGTARGMAEAMRSLAADPEARARLSVAGRQRIGSYDTEDVYARHLAALPAPAADQATRPAGTVLFSDGDRAAERKTLSTLTGRDVLLLRPSDGGGLRFAGRRWLAFDAAGAALDVETVATPTTALFLRAGDVPDADWLAEATMLLARRDEVGAVGGWQADGTKLHAPTNTMLPEAQLADGPGLRVLVRLGEGLCWQEALADGAEGGDAGLLLAHRAAHRLLLDLPQRAVDISAAVTLPSIGATGLLNRDFDRVRPDLLAMVAAGSGADAPFRTEPQPLPADPADLAATLTDSGLLHLEALGGEVLLLRAFAAGQRIALAQSAFSLEGAWRAVLDTAGPVGGALRTESGRMRCHLDGGGRIELLQSPSAGSVRVIWQGRSRIVDLAAEKIGDLAIHLGDEIAIDDDTAAQEDPAAVIPPVVAQLSAQAPLGALFVASGPEDFVGWPAQGEISRHTALYERLASTLERPAAAQRLLESLGVHTLVLSSQLRPSESLIQCLSVLARTHRIVIGVSGWSTEGGSLATRFADQAAWRAAIPRMTTAANITSERERQLSDCNRRDLVRSLDGAVGGHPPVSNAAIASSPAVAVAGPVAGMRSAFLSEGVEEIALPACLGAPPCNRATRPHGRTLDIAVLEAPSVAEGIMHMVGAVWLAKRAGTNVTRVLLPRRLREGFQLQRDVEMGLALEWHDGALTLPQPGGIAIAMACYPEEDWPLELATAVGRGWLPLAGATSAFDASPKASSLMSEPYWEDASLLAGDIEKIAAAPQAAAQLLSRAVDEADVAGRLGIAALFDARAEALRIAG
ncbi:MAG: glycosyltransferase family 4 protein [Pseudomonadota bacterium]